MYNDYGSFESGLLQAWPEANQDKLKAYYGWYQLARKQDKLVLGRTAHLELVKQKYGIAGQDGILLIGIEGWDPIVNDSWIMGGIHSTIPFYLMSVLSYNTVYNKKEASNPDPTRVMYVTTREVAGLNLFGYSRIQCTSDGQEYACIETDAARNATFRDYRIHAEAVALAAKS